MLLSRASRPWPLMFPLRNTFFSSEPVARNCGENGLKLSSAGSVVTPQEQRGRLNTPKVLLAGPGWFYCSVLQAASTVLLATYDVAAEAHRKKFFK